MQRNHRREVAPLQLLLGRAPARGWPLANAPRACTCGFLLAFRDFVPAMLAEVVAQRDSALLVSLFAALSDVVAAATEAHPEVWDGSLSLLR